MNSLIDENCSNSTQDTNYNGEKKINLLITKIVMGQFFSNF